MKKTAVTVLKIAVSVGLFAYIFTKVDIEHIWSEVRQANLWFFLSGILVYLLIQGVSAYRWYLLLKPLGMEIPYPKLLSFYFLGMYFNFFLPTAIGGDVVRVYYLNKETRRLSGSTASVFVDRDLGMAALLLMATVVATFAGTSFNGLPLAPIFGLIGVAFTAANLAIFYRPTYNLLHRLLRIIRMKRVDERIEHLFESVNSYRGKWGLLAAGMALSLGVQVGCVLVNVMLADSIGLATAHGWLDYLVFIPAIGLISMVPVSVNGMGWREISYIVLFQSVGATEPQALTLALMWLAVLVATSLPGGVIYIVQSLRGKTKPAPPREILETQVMDSGARAASSLHKRDETKFASLSGQQPEEPVSTI